MQEQKYVYESPDGGHTVYRRRIGEGHSQRQLHSVSPEKQSLHQDLLESKLWGNIRRAAKTNPALNDLLEQAKVMYNLTKSNEW